jgi:hypothetical protein
MKVKAIQSLCKGSKTITVCERADGTWLGNSLAQYYVPNLPKPNKELFYTLFDIAEKQREDWQYHEMAIFSDSEYEQRKGNDFDNEIAIERALQLTINGSEYYVIIGAEDLSFVGLVDTDYIKPLDGGDSKVTLFVRDNEHYKTLCAAHGFLTVAVIHLIDSLDGNTIDILKNIADHIRREKE